MSDQPKHFLERADLTDEMRAQFRSWAEKEGFPESSAYLASVNQNPNRDRLIVDAAHSGYPPAMLLMARLMENNNDTAGFYAWMNKAFEAGSAEAAYMLGDEYYDEYPYAAYEVLKVAVERDHKTASMLLALLCRDHSAKELQITGEEHAETLKWANEIGDAHLMRETFTALRTGAHPVQFFSDAGIPWGTGTFFLVKWKGFEFAITAHHVLKAASASPYQAHLRVPGYDNPVPYRRALRPSVVANEDGDTDDILLWEIDPNADGPFVEWWSWRMDYLWRPASSFTPGSKIFVVGYPNVDDKYDPELNKIVPQPLIVRGDLSAHSPADGVYRIDCAEFSTTVDGISGGPVFSQYQGLFHFIGMAVRGGQSARHIYFLDALYVTRALDQAIADPESPR